MTELKPLALVTGASRGIGLELAKELARRGFDLVVNAEDPVIQLAATELRTTGCEVVAVQADLRTVDGVDKVWTAVLDTGRTLDVAALNAGVGQGGEFIHTDLEDELEIIDLNITSTVRLAKPVLRDMAARGGGRVLITSSVASTMPGSFQAVYNASKSFLQSFTQAVQEELKDTGVSLTALMPGPTETDFFHRADMDDTKVGSSKKDDAAQVAKQGVAALLAGKDKAPAGSLSTRAQTALSGLVPDKVKAVMHRGMAEPGSGG